MLRKEKIKRKEKRKRDKKRKLYEIIDKKPIKNITILGFLKELKNNYISPQNQGPPEIQKNHKFKSCHKFKNP